MLLLGNSFRFLFVNDYGFETDLEIGDWHLNWLVPTSYDTTPIFKAGRIFAFFPFESGLFEDFAQFQPGKTCGDQ